MLPQSEGREGGEELIVEAGGYDVDKRKVDVGKGMILIDIVRHLRWIDSN